MSQTMDPRSLRLLAWPCYLMAAFLISMPLLEAFSAIASFRPSEMQWRFGTTGVLSTAYLTPPIGVFVALVAAHLLGHRWVQWVLIAFSLISVILLLVMMPMFVLDTLQLRTEVRPQFYRSFHLAAGKVFVNQLATAVVLIGFMMASVRSLRGGTVGGVVRAARAGRAPDQSSPLLTKAAG